MSEAAADTPAANDPSSETTPAPPPPPATRPARTRSRATSGKSPTAATAGKPAARAPQRGLHDAADKLAPVRPAPVERPYSEAVTAEQLQAMRDHGLA